MKHAKPLNETLNNLRRLSGIAEQPANTALSILSRYGNADSGIVTYSEMSGGEDDCGETVNTFISQLDITPSATVQGQATGNVQNLASVLDSVARRMGFDANAFAGEVEFWQSEWLAGYTGQLTVIGISDENDNVGPWSVLFCIKA